jgi:hypothetical protein
VALTDSPFDWPQMLIAWRELDPPEGWRTEILDGIIVLTPPADNRGHLIASDTTRQLSLMTRDDWARCARLALAMPEDMLFAPSMVVLPRAALDGDEPVPADRALLVVEITRLGDAETDRRTKRWGYAHAGVPQYLLIDRYDEDGPAVTLFSEPADGHYRLSVRVLFGESIKLHEPFDLVLDTREF